MQIEMSLKGRPPRKYRNKSIWSSKQEAPLIKKLREHALKERSKAKLDNYLSYPVELELELYAPNIHDYKSSHDYVGDLDAFAAGICESLQPANPQAFPHIQSILLENEKIHPKKAIIFEDDSQVFSIKSKKIKSNSTHYKLKIKYMKF